MFGNHGLCGLPEEDAHEKSPKCLGGNLGDFGEFCKGLTLFKQNIKTKRGGSFSDDLAAYPTIFCGKIGFVPHHQPATQYLKIFKEADETDETNNKEKQT